MFCTNCGKKVYDGDKFCANCGTKVRKDIPEPKPVSHDIVFNPPFKVEAEKRTNEIYKGFVSDKPAEENKRTAEPVNFDWNLSGFPQEPRKTEDIDFNWDSVVERRNQQRREETRQEYRQDVPEPVVDKIDLNEAEKHAAQKEVEAPALTEEDILAALSVSGRVRTPLYDGPLVEPARAAAEMFAEPVWEPVNVAMERAAKEPKKPAEEPETEPAELSEPAEKAAPAEPAAVNADTFDLSELGLITEIPELILPDDPEPETAPEAETKPAAEAEPDPAAEPESAAEQADAEEPAMTIEELEAELFGNTYKGLGAMAPEEAVKSTAQLEKFYTYNKKNEEFQQLLDQEYERLRGMESARRADTESLEFTWARTLFPERKEEEPKQEETPVPEAAPAAEPETAPAEEVQPVSDATLDFSAVREEARMKKKLEAEAAAAEETVELAPAEKPEPAAEPAAEESETETAAEPAAQSEPEVSAESETPAEPEAPAETAAEENTPSEEQPAEDLHDEKAKLRYSDIFPRENPDDDSDAGNGTVPGTAAKVSEVFDADDEDDEPKKMNIIVKLILLILILLILAEGIVLLAKFIAPDSAFSQKADEVIEMLMDRITGGGKDDGEDGGDGSLPVSEDDSEYTYISDILAEKIELPDTIGEVLEDPSLKYDGDKGYAFEEIADAKVLEESEWKTTEDGESVTYAEGILTAIVDYYAQWQATNKDTSLIGINKLEIGEIRTGEKGYYTLCRLTFAGADGEEVVKYATACVKISQNSMILNEIEEEKL